MRRYKFLILFIGLISLMVLTGVQNRRNEVIEIKKSKIPTDKCENCNILLIDIDILRADALPCYGYKRNTAPNICKFAEESVLFENNYSTGTWTIPSYFSTLTSLYPTFHGVMIEQADKLSPNTATLVSTLKERGYRTAYVGNTTIGSESRGLRDFDLVTTDPIDSVISQLSKSNEKWFIYYYLDDLHLPYVLPETTDAIENLTPPEGFQVTEYDYYLHLNSYLKKNYKKVFKKKAIEEYGLSTILTPTLPGDMETAHLFYRLGNSMDANKYLYDMWANIYDSYMSAIDLTDSYSVEYLRMMYDSRIALTDKKVIKTIEKLKSEKLINKTITVITSDHGETFGEHGTFSHDDNNHSELMYTPLIINSPGLSKARVSQTTSNIDIFPTLLDLIGAEKIDSLQGESLIPYIPYNNYNKNRFVFGENYYGKFLQNKEWLYFLPNEAQIPDKAILYNKIEDPKESINVVDKYPDLAKKLFNQADVFRSYDEFLHSQTSTEVYKKMKLELGEEKFERLQKEGYF